MVRHLLLALLLAAPLPALCAAPQAGPSPQERERIYADPRPEVLSSETFLNAHPDMKWRLYGVRAWRNDRLDDALKYFRRAARFGDKPSQAMIGELYWTGEGVPQDRALAYAWMDLASERQYRDFLILRERYWSQLTEAERARALEEGAAIYAEFEDEVAKPRLAAVLRRAQSRVTGSRTGAVGALKVQVPGPGGIAIEIDGSRFYDPQYWEPERYWAWQDDVWEAPSAGRVSVGELQILREDGIQPIEK